MDFFDQDVGESRQFGKFWKYVESKTGHVFEKLKAVSWKFD